jgi:hypothetical protein
MTGIGRGPTLYIPGRASHGPTLHTGRLSTRGLTLHTRADSPHEGRLSTRGPSLHTRADSPHEDRLSTRGPILHTKADSSHRSRRRPDSPDRQPPHRARIRPEPAKPAPRARLNAMKATQDRTPFVAYRRPTHYEQPATDRTSADNWLERIVPGFGCAQTPPFALHAKAPFSQECGTEHFSPARSYPQSLQRTRTRTPQPLPRRSPPTIPTIDVRPRWIRWDTRRAPRVATR